MCVLDAQFLLKLNRSQQGTSIADPTSTHQLKVCDIGFQRWLVAERPLLSPFYSDSEGALAAVNKRAVNASKFSPVLMACVFKVWMSGD